MKKQSICLSSAVAVLSALFLTACGSEKAQNSPESSNPSSAIASVQQHTANNDKAQAYWLIESTDSKSFSYPIPGGGNIEMTATLYFFALKSGGNEMFGQYDGRALVALDMDLSKAKSSGVSYYGGIMEDSISDNISFDLIPAVKTAVSSDGEDIDLAPLADFVGQAEIITDEYTISQQNWKALANGDVKIEVKGDFGDGKRIAQGFGLKAKADTIQITIADFSAAYGLGAFSGTIKKSDSPPDILSKFRDAVLSRMEERLSAEQSAPEASADTFSQGGMTVDSQGREGFDTNNDGTLDIYLDKDGEVLADFDGDGKYEVAGSEGVEN